MNILLIGEMMPIGSCAYRIRYTEARKLAQRGHHVTLITPHQDRRIMPSVVEHKDRLRVIHSPGLAPAALRRGGFSLLDMMYKIKTVLSSDFDVVHVTCGHRPAQLMTAIAARFLKRIPIIDEWWEWYGKGGRADLNKGVKGRLIGLYDRLFELPAKALYSAVIAISSQSKSRLKDNRHVHVLHGGVEVDHLTPGDKKAARHMLNLPPDLFLLGMVSVGRSEHADNLPFLQAFRKLSELEPSVHLFVTGEDSYIREEITGHKGWEKVLYQGWLELEEYSLYLQACDAFVLPFGNIPRNAGRWPHKIGDFLYFERPIITNPTGDFVELFDGKHLGYLCENKSNNYEELILKLINERENLDSMCSDSRLLADELSSNKRVDALLKIYTRAVEEKLLGK